MNCNKCGLEVSEDTNYCPNCGTNLKEDYGVTVVENKTEVNSKKGPTPVLVLVLSIVGLALSSSFFGSIPGIVVSSIASSKGNQYIELGLPESKMVKVGRILSKVGIILGIVLAILYTIFIVAIAVACYYAFVY